MRIQHLVALVASSALVIATPAYAGTASDRVPEHAQDRGAHGRAQAEATLDKVKEIFTGSPITKDSHARTTGGSTEHADATMALRDLALQLDALSPADRAVASRFFARPTDPTGDIVNYTVPEATPVCSVNPATPICVHYVASSPDAPPPADLNANLVNDQVERTLATTEAVYNRIVTTGGYRAPLPDTKGGGYEIDIYLAKLDDNGLYGYCTVDEPITAFEMPGYCVVDDDFAEYPAGPLASLQVTVAHEFFHAVQFAYEFNEDNWFMESTAAWMEDEVYDAINDNMAFLRGENPLANPRVPMDRFDNAWRNYGTWVFWKKLSETYPAKAGTSLPNIVREVWTRAANHQAGGASTMALSKVLAAHNTTFGKFFTKWAVGNRYPARSYSEGRANNYPKPPLWRKFTFSPSNRTLGWRSTRLNHMTNAYARFTPRRLAGKAWRLKVTVNAPDEIRGSFVTLTSYKKSGRIVETRVPLNSLGNGAKRIPYGNGNVKYVEITLTNASNRFAGCYPDSGYSSFTCGGRPRDDNQRFSFKAFVSR